MDLLAELGPPAHVLISYGDKVIDPRIVRGLLEACAVGRLDLGLVAGPSDHYPASGRIVVRNHRAAAILEVPDIQVRQLAARLRSLKPHEWPENVAELCADRGEAGLRELPAIGKSLAGQIARWLRESAMERPAAEEAR